MHVDGCADYIKALHCIFHDTFDRIGLLDTNAETCALIWPEKNYRDGTLPKYMVREFDADTPKGRIYTQSTQP